MIKGQDTAVCVVRKGDYFPNGLEFADQTDFEAAKRTRMPVSVINNDGTPTVIFENGGSSLSDEQANNVLWGDKFVLYKCFSSN